MRSSQFERLERYQTILIESLALFVRYTFSVATTVPEAHQEAARAQGKARFAQYIEQLARHLQRGGSLVKEVHDELYPPENRFHGFPEKSSTPSASERA